MKTTFKKIAVLILLFAFLGTLVGYVNAFPKMDVCNYTNGDKSGDYYDGLCTLNGDKSEHILNEEIKKNKEVTKTTYKRNSVKHNLTEVKHETGGSIPLSAKADYLQQDRKILALKEEIKQKNILLEKYQKENISLKNINKALIITIKYSNNNRVTNTTTNRVTNTNNNSINSTNTQINRDIIKEKLRQRILERNARISE